MQTKTKGKNISKAQKIQCKKTEKKMGQITPGILDIRHARKTWLRQLTAKQTKKKIKKVQKHAGKTKIEIPAC